MLTLARLGNDVFDGLDELVAIDPFDAVVGHDRNLSARLNVVGEHLIALELTPDDHVNPRCQIHQVEHRFGGRIGPADHGYVHVPE